MIINSPNQALPGITISREGPPWRHIDQDLSSVKGHRFDSPLVRKRKDGSDKDHDKKSQSWVDNFFYKVW